MKRKDFNSLIDNNRLEELFNEIGWDHPHNNQPIYITIDGIDYDFYPVAEKSGFQVFKCNVQMIPSAADCKKIDNQLRRQAYDYICVFILENTSHHLWLTPVKTNEKRELVKSEYINGDQADFLWSKIDDLSFELTERVFITDVKEKVQGSFHLNSEKITKEFYTQFRKQHTAFKKHITGIEEDKDVDWYASVMLNRLMFCYFIQKKGFLDMDTNYLQNKLKWVQQQQGENKFFGTFYKGFLCAMFHEGLNSPRHDTDEFLRVYGRIPYLNGGMFDDHQLERENNGIDIADVAFENLFNFFDKWNWHLDTRLSASGKDINPDVLGYIFEQYINDRAAMGAYYTKEDITEYIGKNCIIPFLMDKTEEKSKDAFKTNGEVWKFMQESGDKYIYDVVKKGYSDDWQQLIPDYIRQGIDTNAGNLLERRARWNEKTFTEFALPTEIWRETIERLQRCDSLLSKIKNGEITHINDFITYNLDIRQFAEDFIRNTKNHLFIGHFYKALQGITILDPTCGSGAFLFAALNILEPLYEACLDRMEEWHQQNENLFAQELEEVTTKYSSNRQYFIYKSIILRNLYGVDIMVEATEIAKLRLFLKMVAVVEVDKRKDNLGLDPLPDIDFNIKCGNTLVGYATEDELNKALSYGDMFANEEFKEKIHSEMNVVATAYNCFRSEQLRTYDDNASVKKTKEELKKRLAKLNDLLNHHMHKAIAAGTDYQSWLKSHQPFHWLAEFYQIIKGNGGFDVIIGNPPYVEYNDRTFCYSIKGYDTITCGNLYAFVLERASKIINQTGKTGQIVPVSIMSTPGYDSLRKLYVNQGCIYFSSYNIHPCCLFEGAYPRLSIVICSKSNEKKIFVSPYYKWLTDERKILFSKIAYIALETSLIHKCIGQSLPKFNSQQSAALYNKMETSNKAIGHFILPKRTMGIEFYYRRAFGAFVLFYDSKPLMYDEDDNIMEPTELKTIKFEKRYAPTILAIYYSNLFYWFTYTFSDCRNINKPEIENFLISLDAIDTPLYKMLASLSARLSKDLQNNSTFLEYNYSKGRRRFQAFYARKSKPIIDEIDKVLAKHYGFTDEELDLIINYDIKYRMGDELNEEE